MPVAAKFQWSETSSQVRVVIPLHGAPPSRVDIAVSTNTLKVNFSPYLLDVILAGNVDPLRHRAVVKDGILHVTLFKSTSGQMWNSLVLEGLDKAALQEAKKDAAVKQTELETTLEEARKDRKITEERTSVRQQMALDEAERTRLENLKTIEREAAEADVLETFSRLQREQAITTDTTTVKPMMPPIVSTELSRVEELDSDIDTSDDEEDATIADSKLTSQKQTTSLEEAEEEEVRYIPPPRSIPSSGAKVGISFTPRLFPTPLRESKAAEEEDWISKNRRHLKKHATYGKMLTRGNGVDISEQDAAWLKAKADDFFRVGDYRSASNAYSASLDIDENQWACYSNRSVCELHLGQHKEAITDCTSAMNLLIPRAEELHQAFMKLTATSAAAAIEEPATDRVERHKSLASIIKLLMRRGLAHCQMGAFSEAISDYCSAQTRYEQLGGGGVGLLPGVTPETLGIDTARLRVMAHASGLKSAADSLMGEGRLEEAEEKYSSAIESVPVFVSALSNRAACRMASGNLDGALEDCTQSLTCLQLDSTPGANTNDGANTGYTMSGKLQSVANQGLLAISGGMLSAFLPPSGSDKRRAWLVRTLMRRVAILTALDRAAEAIVDLETVTQIEPNNEQIRADYESLRATLQDTASSVAEPVTEE